MRSSKITYFTLLFILTPLFLLNCFNQHENQYKKIRGSGNLTTKEQSLENINGVHLATLGEMDIKFGNEEKLVIEAEDNLHQYLIVKTSGDTLKIKSKTGYNLRPGKKVKYFLTLKNLDTIVTSSSGNINAPALKSEKLKIMISSSGTIKVKDLDAKNTFLKISSSGKIYTGQLNSEYVEVSISSSGDIYTDEIKASEMETYISSSGSFNTEGGEVNSQLIRITSSGSYKAKDLASNEADIKISSSGSARVYVKNSLKASISSSGNIYVRGNPQISKHYSSSGRIKNID